jgi:phosphopantetheinyl transferase (holo-ACP synthase)
MPVKAWAPRAAPSSRWGAPAHALPCGASGSPSTPSCADGLAPPAGPRASPGACLTPRGCASPSWRELERIATADERDQLETLARSAPELDWAKLLFSAKEAVYKAQFPLAGIALGFQDVSLRFDPAGHFTAAIGHRIPEEHRAHGQGRFVCAAGFAATLYVVRPGS